jgi:hypothetical protein
MQDDNDRPKRPQFNAADFTMPDPPPFESMVFSDPANVPICERFVIKGTLYTGSAEAYCAAKVRRGQGDFIKCELPTVGFIRVTGGAIPICRACADNIFGGEWRNAHARAILIEWPGGSNEFTPDGQTETWDVE